MKLFRLVLALIILVVVVLAVAAIGGFMGQGEAIAIGSKAISILAILGVGIFAVSKLLRS
jgi:hypothetical protein